MSAMTSDIPPEATATGPLSPVVDDRLLEGAAKSRVVRSMFDRIAPRYDMVNRIMTFGLDIRWRRRCVRDLRLPPRSLVLDLACGTGDLCNDLTSAGMVAIGVDFSAGMLRSSRTGSPLTQADVTSLPVPDCSVDGVVCGFAMRNFADLGDFFRELARVLRPGGRISIVDAASPRNRVLRAGHHLYFGRVVPLIGGLLSDRSAYAYLPRSLGYMPPPDELVALVRRAGFSDAGRVELTGGAAQLLTATRDPHRSATGAESESGGQALTAPRPVDRGSRSGS